MTFQKNRIEDLLTMMKLRNLAKEQREEEVHPLFLNLYKEMLSKGMSEACQCGRAFMTSSVPHCPNCGSSNIYAYNLGSVVRILPDGKSCMARGFKCRRCTLPFSDVDTFLHCEALAPQESMKKVRAKEKASDVARAVGFKDIDDFKSKLEVLRAEREAKAKKKPEEPEGE